MDLPLRDETLFKVTALEATELQKAYPGVNVELELKRMQIWLNANPQKRPVRYMKRFIQRWLSRHSSQRRSEPWSASWKPFERDDSEHYTARPETVERELSKIQAILKGAR